MTSERKIKANRANARISTGPKTRHGRARSAKNALRHGLSLPVQSDQALSEEAQALARQIAGPHASALFQILARRIAEAQVDLRRIRHARDQFLSAALADRYRYEFSSTHAYETESSQTIFDAEAGKRSAATSHRGVCHHCAGRAGQVCYGSVEGDETVTGLRPI